jgi:hypothetical protein
VRIAEGGAARCDDARSCPTIYLVIDERAALAPALDEVKTAFRATWEADGQCPLSGEADQKCSWRVLRLMTQAV